MSRNRFIFGGVFIGIGLFVNLFGLKGIKPTVFIISSITITAALLITIYMLFNVGDAISEVWNWVILIACSLLGLVAGFLLTKTIRVGFGIMGGATGFAIGLLMTSVFHVESQVWFWVISSAFGLAFFGLTFLKSAETIIFITSVIGSYIWVRGISIMIPGSYPNEITLVNQLSNDYDAKIPWPFWLYLALILGSVCGGFWF